MRRQVVGRINMVGSEVEVWRLFASGAKYKTNILIWNTRASFGLNLFISDFIDYVEDDISVQDVTEANKVICIGGTIQRMDDMNGQVCYIPCVFYHIPTTDVWLFSPNTYYQMHGGSSGVFGDQVIIKYLTIILKYPSIFEVSIFW